MTRLCRFQIGSRIDYLGGNAMKGKCVDCKYYKYEYSKKTKSFTCLCKKYPQAVIDPDTIEIECECKNYKKGK